MIYPNIKVPETFLAPHFSSGDRCKSHWPLMSKIGSVWDLNARSNPARCGTFSTLNSKVRRVTNNNKLFPLADSHESPRCPICIQHSCHYFCFLVPFTVGQMLSVDSFELKSRQISLTRSTTSLSRCLLLVLTLFCPGWGYLNI